MIWVVNPLHTTQLPNPQGLKELNAAFVRYFISVNSFDDDFSYLQNFAFIILNLRQLVMIRLSIL